jgi:hypothetical protein
MPQFGGNVAPDCVPPPGQDLQHSEEAGRETPSWSAVGPVSPMSRQPKSAAVARTSHPAWQPHWFDYPQHPETPIGVGQPRSLDRALEHAQLMAQRQDLHGELTVRLEAGQCGEEQGSGKVQHGPGPWIGPGQLSMISRWTGYSGGTAVLQVKERLAPSAAHGGLPESRGHHAFTIARRRLGRTAHRSAPGRLRRACVHDLPCPVPLRRKATATAHRPRAPPASSRAADFPTHNYGTSHQILGSLLSV